MQGELFIEVTSLGADSALGRIVGLMEEAQQSKPVVLQRLEEWLRVYVPVVIALAATVLFFFTEDLDRAIAVLIVSFPSSLRLRALPQWFRHFFPKPPRYLSLSRMRRSFKLCGQSVPSSLIKRVHSLKASSVCSMSSPEKVWTNRYSSSLLYSVRDTPITQFLKRSYAHFPQKACLTWMMGR